MLYGAPPDARAAPEGRLSIISVYGPLQPFFDQTWKVPDVERVE